MYTHDFIRILQGIFLKISIYYSMQQTFVYAVSSMLEFLVTWLSRWIKPRKLRQRGGVKRQSILIKWKKVKMKNGII